MNAGTIKLSVEEVSEQFDLRVAAAAAGDGVKPTLGGISEEFGLKPNQLANWRSNERKRRRAIEEALPAILPVIEESDLKKSQLVDLARTRRFSNDRIMVWNNARKYFGVDDLKGLALSMRSTEGAIQDPFGYVKRVGDLKSPDDGTAWIEGTKGLDADVEVCILLGGERRFRATRLNAEEGIEGFDGLWMKVIAEPERKRKFELNLTENTQRSALRFSELSERVSSMLAERNEDGSKVWTQESFAENMGYELRYVKRVLSASRAPERVRRAVDEGSLTLDVAGMLGGLPAPVAERAAEDVAFGPGGVLDRDNAAALIARKYRRELKTGIFSMDYSEAVDSEFLDLDRLGLRTSSVEHGTSIIEGGAVDTSCRGCAEFSGNREDVGGKTTCLNPGCFSMKQAMWMRFILANPDDADVAPDKWTWELGALRNASEVVFWEGSEVEDREIFEGPSQRVSPLSEFVDLAEVPPGKLLTADHQGGSSVPRWGKILENEGLPVTVCFDRKGRVRLMVPLKSAVDAAKLSGFASLFARSGDNDLLTDAERAANGRVEAAVKAEKRSVLVEGAAEFLKLAAVESDWEQSSVVRLIEGALEQGLDKGDLIFLCEILDGVGARPAAPLVRILAWADSPGARSGAELLGFLALVLQCRNLKLNGFSSWEAGGAGGDDVSPFGVIAEGFDFSAAEWGKRLHQRAGAVERSAKAAEEAGKRSEVGGQ